MITLPGLIRRGIALFIVLPLAHCSLFSQSDTTIHESVIRVKVKMEVGKHLNSKQIEKSSTGDVITGFAGIDNMNKAFKVTDFKRVFPPAGKNEARHQKYGLDRWYLLKLKTKGKERDAIRAYQSVTEVETAEPVYKKTIDHYEKTEMIRATDAVHAKSVWELASGSNDPLLSDQWNYRNTGQTGGTPGADIKLIDAWKSETGNRQVIVAVTDGGIEISHPDLKDNLWVNEQEIPDNGIDDDQNGYVDDVHGFSFVARTGWITPHYHATHIAGTIAAATNNGIGVAGIAGGSGQQDGVRLMTCEVFNDNFWIPDGFAESIVYAADNGALISQNSWGYPGPDMYEQAVLDAIDYFIAEAGNDAQGNQTGLMDGGMVIFSAGNDGLDDKYYPAYYPKTFSVASTNMNDVRAFYSNFGSWVDISAPGGQVFDNEKQAILSTMPGETYGYLVGTSMACPHVSGIAALVISKFGAPGFTVQELETRLKASAENIDDHNPGYLNKLGTGRIDAARALSAGGVIPPDVINDLHVTALDVGKVTLSWTVPPDNDNYVAKYDIRFSPNNITESNFNLATSAGEFSASAGVGQTEVITIGAPGPMMLYFAVKCVDFDGNTSPISNVIFQVTKTSPKIAVSVTEIAKEVVTARTVTDMFRLYNKGPLPLQILIPDSVKGSSFATCEPFKGMIEPARHMDIKVTFDANGMAAGVHEHLLKVLSNDPLSPTIVKLVLTVVANGSAIAEVSASELHYNSLQLSSASTDSLTIHNAGSTELRIDKIVFEGKNFSSPVTAASVPPFKDLVIPVHFKPLSLGIFRETIQIYTNDPKRSVLRIKLIGEALKDPPIVISPVPLNIEANYKSPLQTTLTIKNNGSFDRDYKLKFEYKGYVKPPGYELPELLAEPDEATANMLRRREQLIAKIQSGEIKVDSQHLPLKRRLTAEQTLPEQNLTEDEWARYTTNFEEFRVGPVNGQNNWYGMEGWNIEQSNPDTGLKHLRGRSISEDGGTFALSPALDYMRWCSVFSARVNIDNTGECPWYIIPQDTYSWITALRINADKTLDIEDMPTDEYIWRWKRLDVDLPKGYFDLTIAVEGSYEYGNSFLNTISVYINDKRVHTGFSMGYFVDDVAFLRGAGPGNGVLDIDSIMIRRGQYIPKHIELPSEGTVRARETKNITIDIDPTGLKFGTYESEITAKLEKMEDKVIPVAVHTTGDAKIKFYPEVVTGSTRAVISNIGGEDLVFTIEELPGVVGEISGKLAPEHHYAFDLSVTVAPLWDSITIRSNAKENPFKIPVAVGFGGEAGRIYFSTTRLDIDILEGNHAQETIWLSSTDYARARPHYTVMAEKLPAGISVDHTQGEIGADFVPLTIKLDATLLSGRDSIFLEIRSDGYEPKITKIAIHYNILPQETTADITQELWRNVPGAKVSDIPLNTAPSEINILTSLMTPENHGDQYGSRIRGFITAPYSGDYTFWISSDDASELWLSTDTTPSHKKKIAYLENGVSAGDYKSYASQKSALISLQSNRKYYIEILHKEDTGLDHLSVGWQMPNHKREFPIPGKHLSRLQEPTTPSEDLPVLNILAPFDGELFAPPANIDVKVHTAFEEGVINKVELFNGPVKLGEDLIAPYNFSLANLPEGVHFLHARVHANDVNTVVSASRTVVVSNTLSDWFRPTYPVEIWEGVPGEYVSQIPVNEPPQIQRLNPGIFLHYNQGENYGERIRGYFCFPETTTLMFLMASYDRSELWLSTDEKSENKQRIAYVPEPTGGYYDYPEQQSKPITFIGKKVYYMEVLFKKGMGYDHLSVEWFPVEAPAAATSAGPEVIEELRQEPTLDVYPNPAKDGITTIKLFGISQNKARWTITNLAGNVVSSGEFDAGENNGEIIVSLNERFVPGIYVVRVHFADRKISKRLIIMK